MNGLYILVIFQDIYSRSFRYNKFVSIEGRVTFSYNLNNYFKRNYTYYAHLWNTCQEDTVHLHQKHVSRFITLMFFCCKHTKSRTSILNLVTLAASMETAPTEPTILANGITSSRPIIGSSRPRMWHGVWEGSLLLNRRSCCFYDIKSTRRLL